MTDRGCILPCAMVVLALPWPGNRNFCCTPNPIWNGTVRRVIASAPQNVGIRTNVYQHVPSKQLSAFCTRPLIDSTLIWLRTYVRQTVLLLVSAG
ncbi:unnamed protein product [Periconia digitata]|uniref:Secreted protein n=1 Tax=Periconia digitata TaxID=1303443 RepID=A0A9W4XJD9_9PLEO|nr:unnamed protein product [Periconia digitata]